MKKPRGRPELDPDEKRKNRSIKMTDEEWQQIKELAKEAGMNVSQYIRHQCKKKRGK